MWKRWWPFAALMLAGMARWLVTDTHPEAGTTLLSLALGCAWAAALLFMLPQPRVAVAAELAAGSWRLLLAGALLLAAPHLALFARAQTIDAAGLTIALALVPVVIAVADAALRHDAESEMAGQLWPGLLAVGGLLLILVQPALDDMRNDAVYLLAPVLTGVGAAWFAVMAARSRAEQPRGVLVLRRRHSAAACGLAGAAVVCGLASGGMIALGDRPTISLLGVAWDGVAGLLSVLALERLGARRWSAQFVLLPLLILLEGIVFVRPLVAARWIVGLVLLAVAAVYLLLPREAESPTSV